MKRDKTERGTPNLCPFKRVKLLSHAQTRDPTVQNSH